MSTFLRGLGGQRCSGSGQDRRWHCDAIRSSVPRPPSRSCLGAKPHLSVA